MTEVEDTSVSICIATYNMADTIKQSLRSIIDDLPENFEIVVVNQSTDGSKAIIDDVASESDLEFRTIHTDFPLGVGHARNLAVCEATGDIVVTHVDADDWYNSQYFPRFVQLYLEIREDRGSDFFFSCPNMNISSRQYMRENYLLSSLPIGANEKEYRWRALNNGDFLQFQTEADVSGRIKLSDRKDLVSRMRRTYIRYLGMYRIGYSTERIVREDINERSWPLHSRLFRVATLPLVWVHSLFTEPMCKAPKDKQTLPDLIDEHAYGLNELRRRYDLSEDLMTSSLTLN